MKWQRVHRPDGKYIVEPIDEKEAIITAEFNLNAVEREKMTLDVSGQTFFNLQIRGR